MKFGAIIGNPPYQKSISTNQGNSSLSKQLFPYYVMMSMQVSDDYTSLVIPARWFTGDAQDKSFLKLRQYLKDRNNITDLHFYENTSEVFAHVEIKGGVCYFSSDNSTKQQIKYTTKHSTQHSVTEAINHNLNFVKYSDSKVVKTKRQLFLEDLDIILTDQYQFSVLQKVTKQNFTSLMTITKGRDAFGIVGKQNVVDKISTTEYFASACELRCKANEIRYITEDKVTKNLDLFNNFKVFISKSAGAPNIDKKVIGEPYIGQRKTACTDSLIPIGNFHTLEQALNLQKYIRTKFFRFLVSLVKSSQNTSQIVYRFVPLQNFTQQSDIDWSKSIGAIDQQLFSKYGLSQPEIDHIKSVIKEL